MSALSMHVPTSPRAMHRLKAESASPPWGGIMWNTLLHQLSSELEQPPSLSSLVSHFYRWHISRTSTLLYLWILVPPRHLKSSRVCRSFGEHAAPSVTFYCGLLQMKANSSSSLPLLSRAFLCCSASAPRVGTLASRLPSFEPFSNSPRHFLPVAMDDLKTAWLENYKLDSLPVLSGLSGRSLAAGAFDSATLPPPPPPLMCTSSQSSGVQRFTPT